MTSETPALLSEVAAYLEAHESDIIFRWVQIASRLPAHFERTDESLPALVDHMPLVLVRLRHMMVEPLHVNEPLIVPRDVAESHAVTRYEQQMSARTVVKEYQLLRHEIWATLRVWPRAQELTAMDVFLLEERLNFILDDIIAAALDTFVDLMTGDTDGTAPARTDDSGGG